MVLRYIGSVADLTKTSSFSTYINNDLHCVFLLIATDSILRTLGVHKRKESNVFKSSKALVLCQHI